MNKEFSNAEAWDVADILGIPFVWDGNKARAKELRGINLGPLKMRVPVYIVSSLVSKDGTAVFAQSLGNLAMLVVVNRRNQHHVRVLFLIDLIKYGSLNDVIETNGWTEPKQIVEDVKRKEAAVAIFSTDKNMKWEKIS